ncbi:MAG: hypothetical protein FJW14_05130 [Acidimicrobiia bacterium]|nr:hypothetical protein [Acidimicrobiia bacterium]
METDLGAEVERLRTLLERQPSCLMRVGVDGTILAASDAAVSLLGARGLVFVLDTSLVERLADNGPQVWADLVGRVRQSGSASAECEMNDLTGLRRDVVLQGVSHPPHPDGIESMVVVVRDVSMARRLEESLREQQELRRAAQDDLRVAVEQVTALQAQLDGMMLLAQQVVERGRK